MSERPKRERWARITSEAILLSLACLAPWAFGSVEAWATLVIDLGILLVAALGIISGRASGRLPRAAFVLPCLALLALLQAMPIPAGLLKWIDPATASALASSAPTVPERVLGDSGSPVHLPPTTISLDPERSIHAAASLAAAWVLFQCVAGLGLGYPGLRRFGIAITVNAALLALFSMIQSSMWNGKIYGFRASPVTSPWQTGGPFVGHNPLAAYLNLGLGFGLGFLLSARGAYNRGGRAWAVYAVGLIAVGLIASHSRSGLIGTVAGGTVLALVLRREGKNAGLAIVAVGIMIAALLSVVGGSSAYQRIASLTESSAYADRLEIWKAAVRAWTIHPLFGSGLGTFAIAAAPSFGTDYGVDFVRAENEYLDILLEGGLIGLGLAIAGLIVLSRSVLRAIREAPSLADRALAGGGLFGLSALAVQSLGDFSPHLLGVAFPAVVLCGLLRSSGSQQRIRARSGATNLGTDSRKPERSRPPLRLGVATVAIAFVVVIHAFQRARSEAWLLGSDVPLPGAGSPRPIPPRVPAEILKGMQTALEGALKQRPGWSEGHLRLGIVHLALYERKTAEWIGGEFEETSPTNQLSDPLWLHAAVHSDPAGVEKAGREAVSHEPVQQHLVPAARCFLQARRCSAASPFPHAYLASVDYLLEGGDTTGVYAARALRRAGADCRLLGMIAQEAAQGGDFPLAANAWKRAIEVREDFWEGILDAAALALSADVIFEQVLPSGAIWPIRFVDRLHKDPEAEEIGRRYYQEALRRLPDDAELTPPARLRIEAIATGGMGDPIRARQLWERAIATAPTRTEWRQEFVTWLLKRGEIDAAHRQAVIGAQLAPDHAGMRHALVTTATLVAKGRTAD